jgi:16S rRNA (cytosine967-C5)-methyltransferase
MPDSSIRTARDVVTKSLVSQCRRFPELGLGPLATSELDERDAALAHAIDSAVRKRWLTLVAVVESQLTRPWDRLQAEMQAVLLVGAAQLLLMQRVPAHAVLNESVSWAKSNVRGKAGGLVNAVLRRLAELRVDSSSSANAAPAALEDSATAGPGRDELPLETGEVLRLSTQVFSADPVERLAQQTSHVTSLIRQWAAQFGEPVGAAIARHSLVHPPLIIAGLTEEFAQAAATEPPGAIVPHEQVGFAVFNGDRESLKRMLALSPTIRVQDPGSASAISAATSSMNPGVIIDVCAGRGTKTRQLAQLHPKARIIASDADEDRMEHLRQTATELNQAASQSRCARVDVVDRSELRQFDEQADLLVLDVPCSNTGVLARRPEAKYRYGEASLESLVDAQRQIIADSIPLLAPSGSLLYSTCSLDRAENQDQARWIERWHRMRVIRSGEQIPQGLPGESSTKYRDGGYWALLSRSSR